VVGSKNVSVPRGKKLSDLAVRNMPFIVFKKSKQGYKHLYLEEECSTTLDNLELVCPFRSRRLKRISKNEMRCSPISVLNEHVLDTEEVRLSTDFARRMLIY